MSGYCGMLRTDGVAVQEDFLQGITGNPAFRGPDGSCIQAKEPLGFSFSFLERGPSRQARRQPAPAESSDKELVLLTWTAWGEACLPKLLGDFSFGFVGCRGEILLLQG